MVYEEKIQQNYPDFFTQNRNKKQNFILGYSVIHVNNIHKTEKKKKGNLLMLKSIAVSTNSPVKTLVTFLFQARESQLFQHIHLFQPSLVIQPLQHPYPKRK